MKYLPFIFCCLFAISSSYAQVEQKGVYLENAPKSEVAKQLLTQFPGDNVGNEHLYSFLTDEPEADYVFTGKIIARNYYELFDTDIQKNLRVAKTHLYAVQAIRSDKGAFYIIRMPGKKGNNKLALFGLQDNDMLHILDLADADLSNQQDAWILDVDGDTRLDVVIKSKKSKLKGRPVEMLTVYKQSKKGTFKEWEDHNLDPDDFQLESLHSFTIQAGKRQIKMLEKDGNAKKKTLKAINKEKKTATQ